MIEHDENDETNSGENHIIGVEGGDDIFHTFGGFSGRFVIFFVAILLLLARFTFAVPVGARGSGLEWMEWK